MSGYVMTKSTNYDTRTCVYVIAQAGTNFVKIGVARDPQKRLSQLQGGNPFPLHIALLSRAMKREIAQQVECRVHLILIEKRIHLEWFDCSPAEAEAAISMAIGYVRNRRSNLGKGRATMPEEWIGREQ